MSDRLRLAAFARRTGELALFLQILAFTLVVRALLRLNVSTLEALIEPRSVPPCEDTARAMTIARYVDRIFSVRRPLLRTDCYGRGVTLYYFLRRAGVDLQLCFGVGQVESRFAAHCWLLKDGEPFLERKDPRTLFTPMIAIPRRGADSEQAIRGAA